MTESPRAILAGVLKLISRSVLGGFLMGTADLIPGVSGGTIALVLGIYERLVASIREGSSAIGAVLKGDIASLRSHLARVEWALLVPLLGGILLAVVLLSAFLETQLETRPTILAAAFFGLVLGSVLIAWGLIKAPRASHPALAAVVAVGLFVVLGLGDEVRVLDPSAAAFFGAGALAVTAMILPGISGSLILVLVGMYGSVLSALNGRDLLAIGVFALGAVVGLALFSQVLHWALLHHHDIVLAGLIGLMAGSLRILWPWPDGVDSAGLGPVEPDWPVSLLSAVLGIVAVVFISRLGPGRRRGSQTALRARPPSRS